MNFGWSFSGAPVVVGDANATLVDPNGDLRVHVDEFLHRFNATPLCVFEADGALTFGLHAYLTVGIDPLSHTWPFDYPLATPADYSFSWPGPGDGVPVLARIEAGDAKLHLGPDAFRRIVGNVAGGAEAFAVTHGSGAAGTEQLSAAYAVNGTDPWRGPAVAAVSAPVGGRVGVTVSALQPVRNVPTQLLRFRLSSH